VSPFFTTIARSEPVCHTVAYALDAHPAGSRLFLVFPDLTFDDHAEAVAAQALLEADFTVNGHAAFQPHESHLVTVVAQPATDGDG
jgi:hypothetical protein